VTRAPRLRTRLTLWCAASILVILTPVLVGVLALEWRSMRAALDHHLEEDLEVASEMLVTDGDRIVWRTESERDLAYDAGPQRWVEVYTADQRPLFFRGLPTRDAIRASLSPPAEAGSGVQTMRTPAGAWVRMQTAQRTIGPQPVWIRVARSEDPLRHDLLNLFLLFSFVAPLAVLGAAVAGYVIAGRALAPLAAMAERARSISADHLSERLPIENADDELGQLARVFNDTFARLEGSFSRLKQFTADASHELRTPLTAIRSVGEVGLRESRVPEDYQEVIGSMLEEADRLARVVDTLLTLSRWESGRVKPQPETVDLRRLAATVAGHLAVLAEERGVRIDVEDGAPASVLVDPLMARQAVVNIVDNAIKFTREGGRVAIWHRAADGRQGLVVDDEGPGIPVAHRARVLERFYRIDDGRQDGPAGAGLGLAIVQWALTANGGELSIDASELGGARMTLWLPSAPPPRP